VLTTSTVLPVFVLELPLEEFALSLLLVLLVSGVMLELVPLSLLLVELATLPTLDNALDYQSVDSETSASICTLFLMEEAVLKLPNVLLPLSVLLLEPKHSLVSQTPQLHSLATTTLIVPTLFTEVLVSATP
jgi:hypothetical protein